MNELVEMEEVENVATASDNAKPAKKRSFPTVIVAGLGILILILTAATGLICYRSRAKTTAPPQVEEQEMSPRNDDENAQAVEDNDKEEVAPARTDIASFENLVGEARSNAATP